MTVRPISECSVCIHYSVNDDGQVSCPAFPTGVPHEILYGAFDHRQPHPGQENNDLFEPDPSKASKAAVEGILARYDQPETATSPVS